MERITLNAANEAEWLAMRELDVTSTEAAGLFDAGAYEGSKTFYELYHRKAGLTPAPTFTENDRMKWGNRLEAAIAYGIAEDCGLIVEPFKAYMRIPQVRMGASFDFRICGIAPSFSGNETVRNMFREYGPGIMEVKNLDSFQFKRHWVDDGETVEATPQIEFQVQHQLEVADMPWSLISPLVGGNTPRMVIRKRDTEVGALISGKVADLWDRIAKGLPPPPDFHKDADTIAAMSRLNNGLEVDLTNNTRLATLCAERKRAADEADAAEKRKKAATAEILTIIGAAKKAYAAGGFTISAPTVEEKFIEGFTRSGYRRVSISHRAV